MVSIGREPCDKKSSPQQGESETEDVNRLFSSFRLLLVDRSDYAKKELLRFESREVQKAVIKNITQQRPLSDVFVFFCAMAGVHGPLTSTKKKKKTFLDFEPVPSFSLVFGYSRLCLRSQTRQVILGLEMHRHVAAIIFPLLPFTRRCRRSRRMAQLRHRCWRILQLSHANV